MAINLEKSSNKTVNHYHITGYNTDFGGCVTIDLYAVQNRMTPSYKCTLHYSGSEPINSHVHESTFIESVLHDLKCGESSSNDIALCILQYILCDWFDDSMWFNKVRLVRMM